jgi:serine/threonine-protein kinase
MLIRGTYRIERKLGQGGMGTVYLAHHELMDAHRALKFLATDLTADEAFTKRFLREGRTLRQIRHKNVVDCGDLERAEDDTLFFAMEYVSGPDLRNLLHQSGAKLEPGTALKIARGIAEGLGAAHALGMVHRDIKPENVLMAGGPDGWMPKIADFGIVATVETSTIYKTTRGSLLTPPYAAPEQWRGMKAGELDGRTDLYALGGVLFEMLTGRTAFEADSYEGWFAAHLENTPPVPSSLRPELASWKGLDELVLRLLARDREDRPRNVAEVLSLLDAVRHVPTPRRATTPEPVRPRRETVVEPVVVGEPDPGADKAEPGRRKRRFPFVGETIIVLVVAMVIYFSWNESRRREAAVRGDSATESQGAAPEQATPGTIDAAAAAQQGIDLYKQKKFPQAVAPLGQGCAGGIAEACADLGDMYEHGRGMPHDYSQALALYTKGCGGGNGTACFGAGGMYENGRGVTSDFPKAAAFYAKACKLGIKNGCGREAWSMELK